MYSKNLRGAKRRAPNLGVTEASLEQFSEEGGKMISGGGQNPKKCHFTSKKTGKSRAGGGQAAPPAPPLRTGLYGML